MLMVLSAWKIPPDLMKPRYRTIKQVLRPFRLHERITSIWELAGTHMLQPLPAVLDKRHKARAHGKQAGCINVVCQSLFIQCKSL